MSIAQFTAAKSDQLNSEDLISGSITVQVEQVVIAGGDQPVHIHYIGCDGKPYKPSKTMLKILGFAWSDDERTWGGKWLELYREPSVKWAGKAVGGIQIQSLSDIPKPIDLMLSESRGKKKQFKVSVLQAPQRPVYSDEFINQQVEAITNAITGQQATHEQVIEQLQQEADLTEEQKTLINNIGK